MKFFIIPILLLNLLLADGHSEHNHYYSKDLTYLDLTANQEIQMKNILKNYRSDMQDFKNKKELFFKDKQEVFLDDTFDKVKFRLINQKINNLSTNAEIKFLRRVHKILLLKQRKEFVKYINEWDVE